MHDEELSSLIEISQSRQLPLALCLSRALSYASKKGDERLLEFCRLELSGYCHLKELLDEDMDRLQIQHRLIEMFLSPFAKVNLESPQWWNNVSKIIDLLRQRDDFYTRKMFDS